MNDKPTFTLFGRLTCACILVSTFQHGYHIPALNQIQAVVTCRKTSHGSDTDSPIVLYGLPICITMNDAQFSVVTASYTIGGFLGSMIANIVMDRWGRKGAIRFNSLLVTVGAALMAFAAAIWALLLGRLIIGIASGIGICVAPIYILEVIPSKFKRNVGVINQLALVSGIIVTQTMGLFLATPTRWRIVLLVSSLLAFAQFLLTLGPPVTESPVWLAREGRERDAKDATDILWSSTDSSSSTEEAPLLNDSDDFATGTRSSQTDVRPAISILEAFKDPELRTPLAVVSSLMVSRQVSGINAILYYSNAILSNAVPEFGPYVSLGVTVVNFLMTFPPIFLIKRIGPRKVLLASVAGLLVSLICVGLGLNNGETILSSVAVLTFVASFAAGLGPVPWVIILETSPSYAVSTMSTIALSINWMTNFLVGVTFLPLRNAISQGDPEKEGRVFYIFSIVFFLSAARFFQVYRGSTSN